MLLEITAEELICSYAEGNRDFRGIKLLQSENQLEYLPVDLRSLTLKDINLSGADLRNVDFTQTNLTGANLFGAVLEHSCLKSAVIRDANLYSTNLSWCNLEDVDFSGTNLNHMNASDAAFRRSKFSGGFEFAILADASFQDALILKQRICGYGNLIWRTTMPDGSIEQGVYWGDF